MSFEERGAVWIRQDDAGWRIGSTSVPVGRTAAIPLDQLKSVVAAFVAKISGDLRDLDLDPSEIIG